MTRGRTRLEVRLRDGLEIGLRIVDDDSFGAALLYLTGSKEHTVALRARARERRLKLNEYGLYEGRRCLAAETEERIYARLGLAWIPPELRERRGEIEMAAAGRLPRLVELADLRGDLQMHTTATDGRDDVDAMLAAAEALGRELSLSSPPTPPDGALPPVEAYADASGAPHDASAPRRRVSMKVEQVMRSEARHASPATDLATAGRTMAEVGCGFLPIVDDSGRVVGVVTDRDLCLALSRLDRRPSAMAVREAMTREVHSCAVGDDLRRALATMELFRVRRLPVLGADGSLQGIVSLDDVALQAHALAGPNLDHTLYADVGRTLAAISEHPTPALNH